jgi:hypothetical protein
VEHSPEKVMAGRSLREVLVAARAAVGREGPVVLRRHRGAGRPSDEPWPSLPMPLLRPPHVGRAAPGNACHLRGLPVGGRPGAVSRPRLPGWRQPRQPAGRPRELRPRRQERH